MNFNPEIQYGIVSTRLNQKLISKLQQENINLRVFPSPEVKIKTPDTQERQILKKLTDFDWLIVTDIYAADFLIKVMEREEIDKFDLDLVKVCTLGESVADCLRLFQIHVDLIPIDNRTSTIFKAISNFALVDSASLKVLLIQHDNLFAGLARDIANLQQLQVYRTEIKDSAKLTKMKALLRGGAIDAFLFSSVEEITNLSLMFCELNLDKLLSGCEIIALNPQAYQSLRENRLNPKLLQL
jgi:uroporphyrinogen-III synthase